MMLVDCLPWARCPRLTDGRKQEQNDRLSGAAAEPRIDCREVRLGYRGVDRNDGRTVEENVCGNVYE